MKFCNDCGQGNEEGVGFCTQCGATLPEEKKCGHCGSTNRHDAIFCSVCGAALEIGAIPPPPAVPFAYPGAAVPPPPGVAPPPLFGPVPRALPMEATAVAAFVVAIGAYLFCPVVLAVVAIILGTMARNNISRSGGTLGGDGFAVAGIVLGWVNIGLVAIGIIGAIIVALTAR